jgi:serine/threonine-protein kinase
MGSRPDKRFGRYEVVSEIGRGAMGAVYKARDPQINRFVAIKAISAISQSPEEEQDYRQRFFHEAQAAGRLVHPGIVTIFDVGEETETRTPYIVMEYVGGQSLSGLLSSETNKLPLELALKLAEEIADALDCAHQQGVVHRDIKPANILLSGDGHPKIADFGIAKLNLSNVTLPGHALGTPAYMSPEQVDGRSVDGRSDLFSLGVMLYNMVTGHRPFQGNSAVTVCYKVANWDPLPATSFDLALPAELDTLINRALAKEPSQRYQRGSEFASEIRALRKRLSGELGTVVALNETAKNQTRPTAEKVSDTNRVQPALPSSRPLAPERQSSSPPTMPSNLYMTSAALVLVVGFGVVVFGVPFHKRNEVSMPVFADTTPARVPRTPPGSAVASTPAIAALIATNDIPSGDMHSNDIPKVSVPASAPMKSTSNAPSKVVRVMKAASNAHLQPLQNASVVPPVPTAVAVQTVKLKIEVQHHFAAGKLSLWVDDKLAYAADLHGETKRHLAVFHGVDGSDVAELSVSAGHHTLRVNGQSTSHDFDESKTITADFRSGGDMVLKVNFEKNNREMRLALQ